MSPLSVSIIPERYRRFVYEGTNPNVGYLTLNKVGRSLFTAVMIHCGVEVISHGNSCLGHFTANPCDEGTKCQWLQAVYYLLRLKRPLRDPLIFILQSTITYILWHPP